MRVVIADPPAYTPWYDHELAAALARAGADGRARDLAVPLRRAAGARRLPAGRALLSALVAALPPLAGAAAAEGVEHLGRRGARRGDEAGRRCTCSGSPLPQVDAGCSARRPPVFTAHDLLPRRTAEKRELWRRLLGRFDRVVVHTERGRGRARRARRRAPARDPAPGLPERPERADDGQTMLALGVIRPYKGLARRRRGGAPAGRRAAARGRRPGDGARRAARRAATAPSGGSATCRRASSTARSREATVAIFPYRRRARPVAARCCRRSAPACRSVAYDVGGLAEPIARYGAGRVVPAGDVDALTEAARELLGRPGRRSHARARAPSARGPSSPGTPRPRSTSSCTEELGVEPLRRRDRPPARPVRAGPRRRDRGGRDGRAAYNRADRDEAEELYGDYVELVETGTELLADIRDNFARRSTRARPRSTSGVQRRRARRLPVRLEIENPERPACRVRRLEDAGVATCTSTRRREVSATRGRRRPRTSPTARRRDRRVSSP